jgi:type VI secretion system protein VasD
MVLNVSGLRRLLVARLFVATAPMAAVLGVASPAHAQFSYPREQTRLEITLAADAGVNPDDKGRAAPILVRVYELKSEGTFEQADYFSLNANDKAVIAADLLVRDEFILRPGDAKTLKRKSHPDIGAIGVIAGYRDLAQADWRAVLKIDPAPETAWYRSVVPANKVRLQVDLQPRGIQLTPIQ